MRVWSNSFVLRGANGNEFQYSLAPYLIDVLVTDVPLAQLLKTPEQHISSSARTFVVCRLGNDSQMAARALRDALYAREGPNISNAHDEETSHQVVDVIGGLRAWAQEVDPSFPIY